MTIPGTMTLAELQKLVAECKGEWEHLEFKETTASCMGEWRLFAPFSTARAGKSCSG
jgi:hypothetical protein